MIAENIRRLREVKGMTRREFGEMLYVSQDVINNLERGRVEPSVLMIKCICDTFGVAENWLETGEGEMFDPNAKVDEAARLVESVSDSPAMRSLLATWAQLSDENKAVFEKFAADYVTEYNRRKEERFDAKYDTLVDESADDEPEAEQTKKSS